MSARLIRDGYLAEHANAALRLLPQWTQWCIEQGGLTGEFAARSRGAALTEAAALVDEETDEPGAEQRGAVARPQRGVSRKARAPAAQARCRWAGTGLPPESKPMLLNLANWWLSRAMTA